jgi:hypothetical protein
LAGLGAISVQADRKGEPARYGRLGGMRQGVKSIIDAHQGFEVLTGEAFVGDHGVAVELDSGMYLRGHVALGGIAPTVLQVLGPIRRCLR